MSFFTWTNCDHGKYAELGCKVCDPDKGRVVRRYEYLLEQANVEIHRLERHREALRADLAAWMDIAGREYWRENGNPLPTDAQAQKIRAVALSDAAAVVRVMTGQAAPVVAVEIERLSNKVLQ